MSVRATMLGMVAASKAVMIAGRGRPRAGPVLYGLQAFTTADYYQSVNDPGGIAGLATGFWVAVLFRIDSQAVAGGSRTLAARIVTGSGWVLAATSTNTGLLFQVFDGSGTAKNSPIASIPASDVGKVLLAVGVSEGTTVKLYLSRAQVGTQTSLTGYTPASDRTWIGRRNTGSAASSGTIFGACGGHAVPTLAEVQAQADACKAAGDIVAIPGKTDSLWSVKQDQNGAAPATLFDKIGTEPMARQGAPVLVSVPAPVWGW